MRYPAHHAFAVKALLKYVDMILEQDPDAVIVLQADHGLHGLAMHIGYSPEEAREMLNATPEEMEAIWNQTMSAVRLPAERDTPQTREILSDPRNISRYLINEYVGQNYEYIPSQYRQVFVGPEPNR